MTKPSDPSGSADASASPVERAFRLLRYIADGGSTANLSDVARQINVNRVTVMRLLESLKAAGLIEAVPSGGAHRLGMPFLTLAASALGSADLTSRARQILPGLVATTGLSAYLAVLEGTELIYLLCETPETPLVSRIRVGSRIPAHRATPGLAMLATLDALALADLYVGHPAADAADQPDWKALNAVLAKVRETGCAWSFSGLEAGIDSCAAAVMDSRGNVLAALSVAGPNTAFANDVSLRETAEASVKSAASELSRSSL
ncbi:IclR family transcriptional regulator [Paraburkholderia metrosideri]|uniref:HTH-type transcriptional regulator XynR n=1 Tax=Paraburkholderia metrosideri TaxID=580937 RepID=A0ABN7IGI3_9BURK|nr:IclR family transcriptional regulator [Paraburkholderia metrosideri]CAD6559510.1 HTH-type transcriptional regulator XynR [Paraburkholderia metrosideri]